MIEIYYRHIEYIYSVIHFFRGESPIISILIIIPYFSKVSNRRLYKTCRLLNGPGTIVQFQNFMSEHVKYLCTHVKQVLHGPRTIARIQDFEA